MAPAYVTIRLHLYDIHMTRSVGRFDPVRNLAAYVSLGLTPRISFLISGRHTIRTFWAQFRAAPHSEHIPLRFTKSPRAPILVTPACVEEKGARGKDPATASNGHADRVLIKALVVRARVCSTQIDYWVRR